MNETQPAEEVPMWRVRLLNGQERGPVSVAAMRSLIEVGLLDETGAIRAEGEVEWFPLKGHSVWPQISEVKPDLKVRGVERPSQPVVAPPDQPKPTFRLRSADAAAQSPRPSPSPLDKEIPSAMRERMAAAKKAEDDRLYSQLRWHSFAQSLRWVREVFVLLAFLTAEDFLGSFATGHMTSLRWFVDLGIVILALGYYVLFALGT